jgi:hypothetical protein
MPKAVTLPPRKNTTEIPDSLVNEVWKLLGSVKPGQAVTVNDVAAPTQGKAMGPARKVAERLESAHPGLKLRIHVVEEGDDKFFAALSIKRNPADAKDASK